MSRIDSFVRGIFSLGATPYRSARFEEKPKQITPKATDDAVRISLSTASTTSSASQLAQLAQSNEITSEIYTARAGKRSVATKESISNQPSIVTTADSESEYVVSVSSKDEKGDSNSRDPERDQPQQDTREDTREKGRVLDTLA